MNDLYLIYREHEVYIKYNIWLVEDQKQLNQKHATNQVDGW